MGGSIGVTIRLPTGKEYRMERWTNTLPGVFQSPAFIDGKADALADYIDHWIKESAKKDKGETIISSWGMYRKPYLAPSEYGVFVVDYVNKVIISCNSYFNIEEIMVLPEDEELKVLKNYIAHEIKRDYKGDEFKFYKLDMKDWKVFNYEHNLKGLKASHRKIKTLFKLSKVEEKLWRDDFAERRKWEGE